MALPEIPGIKKNEKANIPLKNKYGIEIFPEPIFNPCKSNPMPIPKNKNKNSFLSISASLKY